MLQDKPQVSLTELRRMPLIDLKRIASELGIDAGHLHRRRDLLPPLLAAYGKSGAELTTTGVLEVLANGFGFLRGADEDYLPGPEDIYVSAAQIRRFGLRTGDEISGSVRAPRDGEPHPALLQIASINGQPPETARQRTPFEDLTPIFPQKRFLLETNGDDIDMRVLDLVSPIGRGQRALIVAPPKAGKTQILQLIAHSITANAPDAMLMVVLIDERPAEATEWKRTVKGEVISSTFDESPARHCHVAEMAIERARRQVEHGRDVVLLLDSLTRLTRAHNVIAPQSNRTYTGGLDVNALEKPKKFFGAARNIEGGGSLTIIATALIDTGNRMDDHVYEEFKGTGDMEVHLDRRLANRRLFPAIDINLSSTRKEELLVHKDELQRLHLLRRSLQDLNVIEAMEFLIARMKKTKGNVEFLLSMRI